MRLHFVLIFIAVALAGAARRARSASDADTVRVGVTVRAGNLDPHDYAGQFYVQDLLFEGLVKYERGGEIGPSLAERGR